VFSGCELYNKQKTDSIVLASFLEEETLARTVSLTLSIGTAEKSGLERVTTDGIPLRHFSSLADKALSQGNNPSIQLHFDFYVDSCWYVEVGEVIDSLR
jgi:hypothetical protein